MLDRVKTAIAEKMAPAIDARAPYAKVMFDMAARAAVEELLRPTNEMHKAMCDAYNSPIAIWHAGIKEALKT